MQGLDDLVQRNLRYAFTAGVLAALTLGGCAHNAPEPQAAGNNDGRRAALAPIEAAELLVRESFPPQYAVRIVSGLPSGCAEFERIDVEREGNLIRLSVWNSLPADPNVACTMIYGTAENTAELGGDFDTGRTYRVQINGRPGPLFTAQ